MSYYSTGSGEVCFKNEVAEDKLKALNLMLDNFYSKSEIFLELTEIDPNNKIAFFITYEYQQYDEDRLEKVLEEISKLGEIKNAKIHFVGEDNTHWEYEWINGKWEYSEKTLISASTIKTNIEDMAHAFYSILGCLEDNMPDAEDDYADECWQVYNDSLEEFKKAESNIKKIL